MQELIKATKAISDALNNFPKTAELWLKWLGNPQKLKAAG